jgi:hypothetical protein
LSFKLLLAYTVVLSAVNVTGFPAVARVSALVSLCCCHYYCTVASVLTVLKKYPSATGVSTGSDVPIGVGVLLLQFPLVLLSVNLEMYSYFCCFFTEVPDTARFSAVAGFPTVV